MAEDASSTGTRAHDGARRADFPRAAADLALILVQVAASQARIGQFAARARETPSAAAGFYRDAARRL